MMTKKRFAVAMVEAVAAEDALGSEYDNDRFIIPAWAYRRSSDPE